MRVHGRILAFLVAGPLVVGAAACAKKQVLQDGAPLGAAGGANSAAEKQGKPTAAAPASTSAENRTSAEAKPTTPPPAGTAALAEAPKMAPDKGLGSASSAGLSRIHFGFDKSTLTPEARELLAKNAKFLLSAKPNASIRIEGYCDERGTAEYNVALGERRAQSARQYLEDLGVDGRRLAVVSYGKEMPLDPAHNEEAWAANRRDEFVEVKGK